MASGTKIFFFSFVENWINGSIICVHDCDYSNNVIHHNGNANHCEWSTVILIVDDSDIRIANEEKKTETNWNGRQNLGPQFKMLAFNSAVGKSVWTIWLEHFYNWFKFSTFSWKTKRLIDIDSIVTRCNQRWLESEIVMMKRWDFALVLNSFLHCIQSMTKWQTPKCKPFQFRRLYFARGHH